MITISLIGGLGNQLFQYATGKALATLNNTQLKLYVDNYQSYKLHPYSLDKLNITSTPGPAHGTLIKEHSFNYDPTIMKKYNEDIMLQGYFQSGKYFTNIKDTLIKEFLPKQPIPFMSSYTKDREKVFLHIRRGDYITTNSKVHNVDLKQYYVNAIKHMCNNLSNPHFYVFSDDIQWCIDNFHNDYYFTFVQGTTNIQDLHLMSQCDHGIIANSTFSWWGAYLINNPDKIICAPSKWFNDNKNTNDLIPTTWKIINV